MGLRAPVVPQGVHEKKKFSERGVQWTQNAPIRLDPKSHKTFFWKKFQPGSTPAPAPFQGPKMISYGLKYMGFFPNSYYNIINGPIKANKPWAERILKLYDH